MTPVHNTAFITITPKKETKGVGDLRRNLFPKKEKGVP